MQTIFAILRSILKLTGKRRDIIQVDFYARLLYLQHLYYRTTNQIKKKFQHGSSVVEAKKYLRKFRYNRKKREDKYQNYTEKQVKLSHSNDLQ